MSATTLRVTVTQLPGAAAGDPVWADVARRLAGEGTDLLLLPEMPFAPWPAAAPVFDAARWRASLAAHDEGVGRLGELGVPAVVSSRPVERDGHRHNEAFLWTARAGYRPLHVKSRLPEEDGFWEATWFSPGPEPEPAGLSLGPACLAAAICSELWHFPRARAVAEAGVGLLLTPRATSSGWNERWLVAGRAAAVTGGLFVLSSNRVPTAAGDEGVDFGGAGFVVDPDGEVLARTDPGRPLVTREIDLAAAGRARSTYPRNLVGPAPARPAEG